MDRLIKSLLIFGGVAFIADGLLHFLNLKLNSVLDIWPESALTYAYLLNFIYASFIFLAAGTCFILQKDIKKYKTMIIFSAFWALFHGILLVFLALTQNYTQAFKGYPSLYVWLPFYDKYLILEGSLLIIYAISVYWWIKGKNVRS